MKPKGGECHEKRIAAVLLFLALTAGMIGGGFTYFGFVSRTIHEESTAHLTEIFHQANQSLFAMTANAFAEDVQALLDAGRNGHIAKPIVMEEAVKAIARNLS